MINPKTTEEIKLLRDGGKRLSHILHTVRSACAPGVPLVKLDEIAASETQKVDGEDAFFNYQPKGARRPYPAHICVSINDEIVHGIPNEGERILYDGDLVTLDMGLVWNELITDSAITFVVGNTTPKKQALVNVTKKALDAGIAAAQVSARVGDISAAIQKTVENDDSENFSIFKELVGHGVGYSVHEEPYVPNVGLAGVGDKLPEGTVIAIEPMIGLGSSSITLSDDGYTYKTQDSSLSAHFEHTVAVTSEGPVVLTSP